MSETSNASKPQQRDFLKKPLRYREQTTALQAQAYEARIEANQWPNDRRLQAKAFLLEESAELAEVVANMKELTAQRALEQAERIAARLELSSFLSAEATFVSTDEIERVWARTDRPVSELRAIRSWVWGPGPLAEPVFEPYAESPDGLREVTY